MKHFFTICLMALSVNSIAQFDLSIQITDPTDEMEFDAGADVSVDIELTNWGDIIPEFDTLYLGFILNDVFYGPSTGVITGASIGGGGVPFPVNDVVSFNDLSDGTYTLCAWIIGIGSVESGQNFDLSPVTHLEELGDVTIVDVATEDPTPENNEHCITFYVGDTSVVIDDVSVYEDEANGFSLYPNPAIDDITIQSPEEGGYALISNLNGQTLMNQEVIGTTNLDVSELADGIYILSFINNQGILVKNEKIVIRK